MFALSAPTASPAFSGLVLARKRAEKGTDGLPIPYLDSFIYLQSQGMVRPNIVLQTLGSRHNRGRLSIELPSTWGVVRQNAKLTEPKKTKAPRRGNKRLVISLKPQPGFDKVTLSYNGKVENLQGVQVEVRLHEARSSRVRWDVSAFKNGAKAARELIAIIRPDMKKNQDGATNPSAA